MFGFGPFSESPFSDLSEFVPGKWVQDRIVLNTWTGDVGFFSVLSSNGQSYVVSREVLTSTGVAYLVSGEVLTSSGVIVDLANPWQNVSTASNTWS